MSRSRYSKVLREGHYCPGMCGDGNKLGVRQALERALDSDVDAYWAEAWEGPEWYESDPDAWDSYQESIRAQVAPWLGDGAPLRVPIGDRGKVLG